jgi:hypothetical protein
MEGTYIVETFGSGFTIEVPTKVYNSDESEIRLPPPVVGWDH